MDWTVEIQASLDKRAVGSPRLLIALLLTTIVMGACTLHTPRDVGQPGAESPAEETPAETQEPRPEETLPPIPEEGLRIVVSKADRLLTVYQDTEAIRRYPVGLGSQPRGRKRWEGDGRTPEGRYAIATKNPRSKYYLSVGLNYPAPGDALQGYREGRITREQYLAIEHAFDEGNVPPWNTRLGGEIFIHGHGAARDWTRGCIALNNADMRELYSLVDVGTPVTIVP